MIEFVPVKPINRRLFPDVSEWYSHEQVESTQQTARSLVDAQDQGKPARWVVIEARRQTSGLGRTGPWLDPGADAVFLSVARSGRLPTSILANLPIRIAEQVADQINLLGCDPPVVTKQPNDLFVGDQKCGGILIDSRSVGDSVTSIVVGIGLNVGASPSGFTHIVMNRDVVVDACVRAVLQTLASSAN